MYNVYYTCVKPGATHFELFIMLDLDYKHTVGTVYKNSTSFLHIGAIVHSVLLVLSIFFKD